ncbi:MAG: hypothetical protein HYY84_02230 [Deltaproteobacteria bacterium]|nr:hypothetical protein [Deltaproteobacteria bacterium]
MVRRSTWVGLLVFGVACSGVPTPSTSTYVATADEGDLAGWAIDSNGAFSVAMTPVDSEGSPVDGGAYTIAGACAAKNGTYDYRICTVASVTPARPSGTFPRATDSYFVLELPGVAVVAAPLTNADAGKQAHVGIARGACGDFSGTYSFTRAGHRGFIPNLMGQFTLVGNSAGEILSIDSWHHGLVVNGQASTGSNADPIRVALITDPANAHPALLDAGTTSCANGVITAKQSVEVSVDGGTALQTVIVRINATAAGGLLVDFPYGFGGAIGIRSTAAASITDLLGKNYVILGRTPTGADLFNVTVDGDAGVTVNSTLLSSGATGFVGKLVALSNPIVDAYFGAANIVDAYNPIQGTSSFGPPDGGRALAPSPASFAGFFAIVDSQNRLGTADNVGEAIIFLAQKSSSGIFLTGAVADVNHPGSFSCILQYGYQLYCLAGPFIGFSR